MFKYLNPKKRIQDYINFRILSLQKSLISSFTTALADKERTLSESFTTALADKERTLSESFTTALAPVNLELELHNSSFHGLFSSLLHRQTSSQQSIGIIIATKNRFSQLMKALTSVLMQTRLPSELIIVNDGIEFTKFEIDSISALCSSIENLRVIDNIYPGVSGARKFGVESSKSVILTYLDDDNLMWPTWVETIDSSFQIGEDDLIYGAQFLPEWPGRILFRDKFDLELLLNRNYIDLGVIAHKREVGTWNIELRREDDWDFILSIATVENAMVRSISQVASVYFTDAPNRISDTESESSESFLELYKAKNVLGKIKPGRG